MLYEIICLCLWRASMTKRFCRTKWRHSWTVFGVFLQLAAEKKTPKMVQSRIKSATELLFSFNVPFGMYHNKDANTYCTVLSRFYPFWLFLLHAYVRKRGRRKNTSNNQPSENTLDKERCATNICYVLNTRAHSVHSVLMFFSKLEIMYYTLKGRTINSVTNDILPRWSEFSSK